MPTWRLQPPKNKLPISEYDDVVILNYTQDLTLQDAYGRNEPEMEGDIVLGPRKGSKRKKFAAKHWFGDWDKEGPEWTAEIERLKVHYGPNRLKHPLQYGQDGKPLEIENPIWTAIKNHQIVVKGYTENKDYSGGVIRKFEDLKPTFSIDETPDSELMQSILNDRGKRGETFDISSEYTEEVKKEVLAQNLEQETNTAITKLKRTS